MDESIASFHCSTQRGSALLVRRAYLMRYSKYESLAPPQVCKHQILTKRQLKMTYDVLGRERAVTRIDTLTSQAREDGIGLSAVVSSQHI